MKNSLKSLILFSLLFSSASYGQAIQHTSTTTSEDNLTDQEKILSETYMHDGRSNRILEEACKNGSKKDLDICNGQDPNRSKATMMKALSQMYTLVVSSIPDMDSIETSYPSEEDASKSVAKPKKPAPEGDQAATDAKPDEAAEESDTVHDYCRYIASGTEAVALFQQQLAQQDIGMNLNEDSAQRQALEKAYLSHKERAKTAKVQYVGWGSTTACYVAMAWKPMATGGASWKTYLKTAAAATLTAYYKGVVDDQESYMSKVNSIKDRLPKAGDCNPVTNKDCYCSEPSTQYDPTYCMDKIREKQIAENSVYVSCLDENLKVDEDCSCDKTDSCYSKKFLNTLSSFEGAGVLPANAFKSFNSLTNGELINGQLTGVPDSQLLAIANKALKDKKINIKSKVPLTNDQKEVFEGLQALGLSKDVASSLASVPYSKEASANTAKFGGSNAKNVVKANYKSSKGRSNSKVLTFSGGSGINAPKQKSKNSNDFNFNKMLDKFKKKSAKTNNGNVLKFAERAGNNAQITKDSSRPIFDIISRRYRVSGWKKLELDQE